MRWALICILTVAVTVLLFTATTGAHGAHKEDPGMPPFEAPPLHLRGLNGVAAEPYAHPAAAATGGPKKNILVLDLDETLVHSEIGPDSSVRVAFRPHVAPFLRSVTHSFGEVVAFTAGAESYADGVFDTLSEMSFGSVQEAKKQGLFKRRLFRDSCTTVRGPGTLVTIKDLRLVSKDMARVVLLDNTPSTYTMQPENGIPIASFWGGDDDDALLEMVPKLLVVAGAHDVRAAVGNTFR
jgi:RNA polymerase II subunit A small phosphatase-like protein